MTRKPAPHSTLHGVTVLNEEQREQWLQVKGYAPTSVPWNTVGFNRERRRGRTRKMKWLRENG